MSSTGVAATSLVVVLVFGSVGMLWTGCTADRPFGSNEVAVEIRCDRFEIKKQLSGDTLRLSLDTDLPDFTDVMVSVSRSYYQRGSSEEYSVEYFDGQSKIGDWRSSRMIRLDNAQWRAALRKKQTDLAPAGLTFDVDRIADDVEISATVPVNQSDPRFERRNKNLVGKMVSTTGLRVIRREESFAYPLSSRASLDSPYGNYNDLQVGRRYKLSQATVVMPALEPPDPLAAMAASRTVEPGTQIIIKQRVMRDNDPWYQVEAKAAGLVVARGWINSMALMHQRLEIVR